MMRMAWTSLVVGIAAVAAACGGDDDEADVVRRTPCMELREHVVDLRMRTTSGTPQEMADLRAAFSRALGPSFESSCEANLSSDQVECSLRADDLNAMSACAGTASTTGGQP